MNPTNPLPKFAGISPRAETHEELSWFFNHAEKEADVPSLYLSQLTGVWDSDETAIARRIEALRAARTIHGHLQGILAVQAYVLGGLYTERPWPRAVAKAFGVLAGVVEGSALVRDGHFRALAKASTRSLTVTTWLEELIATGGTAAVAAYRKNADESCAMAICAYERARRKGPSVVPAAGVP